MGRGLHQTLKSLCSDTEWSYAIFWKLKHGSGDRMVLTLEDVYYNGCGESNSSDNSCFTGTLDSLCNGNYSHDLLELAVAKMSYHVYPLGEGIVGQVAVTGKYQWIIADNHGTNLSSSFDYGHGWPSQFSAGIRTIVVVPDLPHGVVQLGSLYEVAEDMKLVTQIRNLFLALRGSSVLSNMESSSCLLDLPKKSLDFNVTPDSLCSLEIAGNVENPGLNDIKLAHQNQGRKELLNVNNFEGETGVSKELSVDSELNIISHSHNCIMDGFNVYNQMLPVENLRVNLPPGLEGMNDSSAMELEEDLERKREFQTASETFLKFPSGCELYEALGPAFQKKSINLDWEAEKSGSGTTVEIPPEMSNGKFSFDSGSEHLLEAVVANISDVKSEKSISKSVQSLLTAEITPEPYSYIKHSIGYLADQPSNAMSSKGLTSPCVSTISEQLERSSGPVKNKRRGRSGETCRPRPRDRQLIQDRIKELRELVPSGSKCSIDSLLERTIKHMLFLQSITKHADKLSKCSDTKLLHRKEMGVQGSSTNEHGSSWAVEIGSHLKVCSIIVENINKNGQMLVELLCDDCTNFLQIAEAITSLDLTILKGVTEPCGEKTWICFVVEGQNNRSIHRMDILWSLVQILQPNTTS